MPDPKLWGLEDVERLSADGIRDVHETHVNPGQLKYTRMLGFDRIRIDRARGAHYFTPDGTPLLDFMGGFGSVNIGHNHPRILALSRRFQEALHHDISQTFLSAYAAGLVHNLAELAPGDLDFVFLGNTGSEVMEAAIKLAEQYQGPDRTRTLYAKNSFHGKSKGALSVTDSALLRGHFRLIEEPPAVPFGDADALEAALAADPRIGAVVLETIQGGAGIVVPPAGYFSRVRDICNQRKVLLVLDEVQCGLGRTGKFFAFEHEGIIPDVVAVAKSLGGAKAAVAAYIARRDVYLKAYGDPKTSIIHGFSTFGGMGEGSAIAMEAVKIIHEEKLAERAGQTGEYLMTRLRELKDRYPSLIKDVRGRGLMVGVEFQGIGHATLSAIKPLAAMLDDRLQGGLPGLIGALLCADYRIVVAFTEYNRNVIRLEPPLVLRREDVDYFIQCLDALLSKGPVGLVMRFMARRQNFDAQPIDTPPVPPNG
ncbi:aspartate aminotransferase family protein [bacterium]|nr:aspartate aminotransferase family protein [bacterium]